MAVKLAVPESRICAYKGCGKPFTTVIASRRFCCGAHRTAAWTDSTYIRRKPKEDTWTGPRCHCGRPARFEGFCGNHNLPRRAEKARWRKALKDLQAKFTLEQVRALVEGEASTGC